MELWNMQIVLIFLLIYLIAFLHKPNQVLKYTSLFEQKIFFFLRWEYDQKFG